MDPDDNLFTITTTSTTTTTETTTLDTTSQLQFSAGILMARLVLFFIMYELNPKNMLINIFYNLTERK
jgi:hypothetical protein